MAEDWKQIWNDMRAALRGAPPETDTGEPAPQVVDAAKDEAVVEAMSVDVRTETAVSPTPQEADESANGIDQSDDDSLSDTSSHPKEIATPFQQQTRRVLIVLALLAAAAWVLVNTGLLGRIFAPTPPAPDVIASFGDDQLTIADLEAHLNLLTGEHPEEIPHTQDEIIYVLENMVLEELVQRWVAENPPEDEETFSHAMQHINEELSLNSIETGLHEGDIPVAESEIQAFYYENRTLFGDQPLTAVRAQIKQTLVAEQEQSYVETYLQQLKENASITRYFELLEVPPPTEDDLRRYYEENKEQFTEPRRVVVKELQFPIGEDEATARQDADAALLKLRAGTPFVEVPSSIPRAIVSTDILISEGVSDPGWETTVFAMTENEMSNVFRAGSSFYIVQLQEKIDAYLQPSSEVQFFLETAVTPKLMDNWFTANAGKTLFTLKSSRYTVGEFYQEYQELPFTIQAEYSGPEGMKELAEALIERLLLVSDANDRLLDVENQPLAEEARLQVLQQMMHEEEVDDKISFTDEEIQQFYDENQELMARPPQVRVRYIRIGLGNSADEAESARQRINEAYERLSPGLFQKGEGFTVIAQEYSEDPETAVNGGERPGWIGISPDILTEFQLNTFNEVALTLQTDEISTPFQFGDSFYIVEVIERTEPEVVGLEQARPFIEEILGQEKHKSLEIELEEKLLAEADMEIYWSVLNPYLLQFPTPEPIIFPFIEPPS